MAQIRVERLDHLGVIASVIGARSSNYHIHHSLHVVQIFYLPLIYPKNQRSFSLDISYPALVKSGGCLYHGNVHTSRRHRLSPTPAPLMQGCPAGGIKPRDSSCQTTNTIASACLDTAFPCQPHVLSCWPDLTPRVLGEQEWYEEMTP
jgi:hypothetical protein